MHLEPRSTPKSEGPACVRTLVQCSTNTCCLPHGAAAWPSPTLQPSLLGTELWNSLFHGFDDTFLSLCHFMLHEQTPGFLLSSLSYLHPASPVQWLYHIFRNTESWTKAAMVTMAGRLRIQGQPWIKQVGCEVWGSSFTQCRKDGGSNIVAWLTITPSSQTD